MPDFLAALDKGLVQYEADKSPDALFSLIIRVLRNIVRPIAGLIICSAFAVAAAFLFRGSAFRKWIPLLFLLLVLPVSRRLGRLAGVLGTCTAALIFAIFLFSPVGTWVVLDESSRNTLGWMTLGGMAIAHFAGRDLPSKAGAFSEA